MKKIMLCLAVLAMTFTTNAQIQTPQASPLAKVEQKVGLTDLTLEYSRPSMKGRKIFGDLVPYEKTWRTGANNNTKLTVSTPFFVDGKELKAGTYAIYTIPYEGKWQILFYTDSNNWGLPQTWDDVKVAATATAAVYPLPMEIETLTMTFDDLSNDEVTLGILWEKTYVGLKLKFPTHKMVMMNIESAMKDGENTSKDDLYAAAVYYAQNGEDINQAKNWIDQAMKGPDKPQFWKLRQQSLIYAQAGDKKGAIALAKQSLEAAEAAGNADYVKMNKDSLKEWGAK
ncbi:DUF2911 domain-containing protein [Subsaxibacter sp. CAU 1640]|uniref:DUF2911 domain-containing protein n=1 Tax=Subsaxibacter sp. CAU 1640 TaxID=2933271 RepID=UPI002004DCAE|nr:DUF2911 domain-containing protein [Subsaxibacter sp. CAU 1640]MCK7591248.1 DUF2911 domain-containing protein [Subsaxibacter sp. CAU 1640]